MLRHVVIFVRMYWLINSFFKVDINYMHSAACVIAEILVACDSFKFVGFQMLLIPVLFTIDRIINISYVTAFT